MKHALVSTRFRDLDTCLDDYRDWYVGNQERVSTLDECVLFLFRAISARLLILHFLGGEVMALRQSHTTGLDAALDKFTQWYASNAEDAKDPLLRLQFLKKATDDSLHLLHLMRDELRAAQDYKRQESHLYLPEGFVR